MGGDEDVTSDDIFMAIVKKYTSDKENCVRNTDFRDLIDRLATDPTVVVDFTSFGALDKAIADADKDKNGYIDLDEFHVLLNTGFIAPSELARCLNVTHDDADPEEDRISSDNLIEPVELVVEKPEEKPAAPSGEIQGVIGDTGPVPMGSDPKSILGAELHDAFVECFALLDLDCSGSITRDEAICLMANASQADQLFMAFDSDKDGSLSLLELLSGSADLVAMRAASREGLWTQVRMVNKLLKQKRQELGATTGTAADLKAAMANIGCAEGLCSALDYTIMAWDRAHIRKALRVLNVFMVALIWMCVLLGILLGYTKDFPGIVLASCLSAWGFFLLLLEVRCDCCGIDKWLAHNVTMLYMASGRSIAIAASGPVCIGMGFWPAFLGMLLIFPYGLISRYIIAVHPLCGDFFITTDPEYFLTHNNEIIQPSDRFIMETALRATQAMTPFAFEKFECELAPIRILQSMDRVRLQKKLDESGVPTSPHAVHDNEVKIHVGGGGEPRPPDASPVPVHPTTPPQKPRAATTDI